MIGKKWEGGLVEGWMFEKSIVRRVGNVRELGCFEE